VLRIVSNLKFMSKHIIFLFLFLAVNSFAQQINRGPYLQVGTPESVVIRWRTDVAVVGKINYGTQLSNLNSVVLDTAATTEHEVKISGLNPATKYYYNIGTNSSVTLSESQEMFFKTSPLPGTRDSFRFWVIGDFGNGSQGQIDVKNAYLNYTGATETDAWIWLGDNAYSDGTDVEYQTKVFQVYPNEFKKMIAWPCPGNHDYGAVDINNNGPYYDILTMPKSGEAGGEPSGTEGYFSFDYGNVHFISLNTEYLAWVLSNTTAMANWLKADLARNDKDWTIVFFHQPPYSKGSHDSDDNFGRMEFMRSNFNPILESYGVDLVLTGHSHGYERSYMLKGHYGKSTTFDPTTMIVDDASPFIKYTDGPAVNEGTVYTVVGCSGQLSSSGSMDHPANAISTNSYRGSLVIDVNGLNLSAKFLTATDGIKDEFLIRKGSVSENLANINEAKQQNIFAVFPNPNRGTFEVKFSQTLTSDGKMTLIDSKGRVVKELYNGRIQSGESKSFAISDLASGVYFIRIQSAEIAEVVRVFINN